MRPLLLAGASLLALAAAAISDAGAAPITFSPSGGLQSYTVPMTGLYEILAVGAQGGAGDANFARGGYGEQVSDEFDLVAGEVLTFAVGSAGLSGFNAGGTGGGGGSFVVVPGNAPLLVAGGGGGGYARGGNAQSGTVGGPAKTWGATPRAGWPAGRSRSVCPAPRP